MIRGQSYFGGNFVAANFAYGQPGGPQALSVYTPTPIAAGTRGVPVAFGYCTTSDGYTFYPLATNAPIGVGADSNYEEVTPSAVSADTPEYGGMNFTATFSDAHGSGDPVVSATFGLQEAINFAALNGGGNVIIDATWTALGGTNTIKNAAVFPSPNTVTIVDNRT